MKWAPLMELMLARQPIWGNAEAAQSTYLHEVFSERVLFRDRDQYYAHPPPEGCLQSLVADERACNRMIHALLAAGADHKAKSPDSQLPVEQLMNNLSVELRHRYIPKHHRWFERLTRGLDDEDVVRCNTAIWALKDICSKSQPAARAPPTQVRTGPPAAGEEWNYHQEFKPGHALIRPLSPGFYNGAHYYDPEDDDEHDSDWESESESEWRFIPN